MGKINVNSNAYIITYSVVMVVIVAILLSVAALGLKDRQDANILNEKKTQIVKALGHNPEKVSYEDAKITAYILDKEGKVTSDDEKEVFEALNKIKDSFAAGKFPVFEAEDGSVVIPLYGAGLWGPIWGYLALEKDMNTIKGIVMDHQGETPGLGAEIATAAYQANFVPKELDQKKKIYNANGELVGITIVKAGKGVAGNKAHEVDAISGGTKTCDGVTKMFESSLKYYEKYLKAKMNPGAELQPLVPVNEEQKQLAEGETAEVIEPEQPAENGEVLTNDNKEQNNE